MKASDIIAVIGAGPVGLAAAAHLSERGLPFVVLEQGTAVGAALREWGHVRLFSPWGLVIDPAAERLLTAHGWQAPAREALPTGAEIVEQYLQPLADLPPVAPHLRFGQRVTAISRRDYDKVKSAGRTLRPFVLALESGERIEARAVIDASGTWFSPNPLGASGLPARGERDAAAVIAYGIPDSRNRARARYANRRVLVVGSGHSAMNAVLDLLALQEEAPQTRIFWALRRSHVGTLFGGGSADALAARGALGQTARQAVERGAVTMLMPFAVEAVRLTPEGAAGAGGVTVEGRQRDTQMTLEVDEIIACTGFRPDLSISREIRLRLDPWLEAPEALAPLIDPNVHSCGSVPPHGAVELTHPEADFYVVGMKSYGRAPTFLMATGYEQVRSVVARLAGDEAAARRVELVLPETGVCGAPLPLLEQAGAGCCGGPATEGADACCVADADAKAAGKAGCGCTQPAHAEPTHAGPARAETCCG